MATLWCGGEDIDFPNGTAAGTTSSLRAGWSRGSVSGPATAGLFARSNNFPAGGVTSFWVTWRQSFNIQTNILYFGIIKDSTSNAGIWIGVNTPSGKGSIIKYDGATKTTLVTESGTSFNVTTNRFDMQVINFGSSCTINLYMNLNPTPLMTFTGDASITGVTSLSAVGLGSFGPNCSEIIVSDIDTRSLLGLQTLALTGAGTTNDWTNNTFSNVNPVVINDANPTSSDVNNQVQGYNVTDPVAGTYDILMVKTVVRAAKSSAPTVNQVQLRLNNGSGSTSTGVTNPVATVYTSYELYNAINPITSANWVKADITPLQLEIVAKT